MRQTQRSADQGPNLGRDRPRSRGPRQPNPVDAGESAVGVESGCERRHETVGRERVEVVLPPEAGDPENPRLAVDARLDPADEAIVEVERQDVVAPPSLGRRDVDLPEVVEAVEGAEEIAVPDERIERREKGRLGGGPAGGSPTSTSRSACSSNDSSPVTTCRSPRSPSIVTGTISPASISSSRRSRRKAPPAPVPIQTSACPPVPRSPWAR